MASHPQHIFFLGIAGIGVSALAQVAQARGVRVSGSDPNADPEANPAIARLQAGGASLFRTHRAENLAAGADLVVASAAIAESNPEVAEAKARGVRIVSRAEFLGELMAAHQGVRIAVAGTHGKTTTTAMLGVLLQEAGLDPTVFVGGEVPQLGGNVRIGSPTGAFVAEACEAYDSFLHLQPDITVITNLEPDHLDHYATFDALKANFLAFCRNLRSGGTFVLCGDDATLQAMREAIGAFGATRCYGFGAGATELQASQLTLGANPSFTVEGVPFQLQVPGKHNVSNAMAACGVARTLNLSLETIAAGLATFRGTERRQEKLGEAQNILVMDDYAHHPTEIRATMEALRAAHPTRRMVAVFQPHLYSRTRDFLHEFAEALALADALLVTDIYAAREQPIEGVHASELVRLAAERKPDLPALFVQDKRALLQQLLETTRPNDLVLVMGAGDIRAQGEAFVRLLQQQG